ncbi:flagellar hook-length control protein FliK [Pseudooceanicola sediminis]|uniref:Flagellar hook-length control protein FliK n=2 Tax=Pseudooceanicola sediminis TaxID=2211117 RepID=A0A399JC77_9RHOB|nr:flagellar hook-length control protein FliK [Pseudooceanicola sediminis]|tara:strand:+ start:22300 stop:24663 length:2364 start_codon:yes stop_codon:yes gene_type:complete
MPRTGPVPGNTSALAQSAAQRARPAAASRSGPDRPPHQDQRSGTTAGTPQGGGPHPQGNGDTGPGAAETPSRRQLSRQVSAGSDTARTSGLTTGARPGVTAQGTAAARDEAPGFAAVFSALSESQTPPLSAPSAAPVIGTRSDAKADRTDATDAASDTTAHPSSADDALDKAGAHDAPGPGTRPGTTAGTTSGMAPGQTSDTYGDADPATDDRDPRALPPDSGPDRPRHGALHPVAFPYADPPGAMSGHSAATGPTPQLRSNDAPMARQADAAARAPQVGNHTGRPPAHWPTAPLTASTSRMAVQQGAAPSAGAPTAVQADPSGETRAAPIANQSGISQSGISQSGLAQSGHIQLRTAQSAPAQDLPQTASRQSPPEQGTQPRENALRVTDAPSSARQGGPSAPSDTATDATRNRPAQQPFGDRTLLSASGTTSAVRAEQTSAPPPVSQTGPAQHAPAPADLRAAQGAPPRATPSESSGAQPLPSADPRPTAPLMAQLAPGTGANGATDPRIGAQATPPPALQTGDTTSRRGTTPQAAASPARMTAPRALTATPAPTATATASVSVTALYSGPRNAPRQNAAAAQPAPVTLTAEGDPALTRGADGLDGDLTGLRSADMPGAAPDGRAVTQRDLARHIANQIASAAARPDTRSDARMTEVRLDPEELGRVSLRLSADDIGVTLHVTAERADTMDLMRRHISLLQDSYRAMGYQRVEISINGQQTGGSHGQWAGGGGTGNGPAPDGSGDRPTPTPPAPEAAATAQTESGLRQGGLRQPGQQTDKIDIRL